MSNIDFGQMITADDRAEAAQALRRQQARAQAEACLAGTDWYLLRQAETGRAVPAAIRKRRAAARRLLSASGE